MTLAALEYPLPALNQRLGATPQSDGHCVFRVWAPQREHVALQLHDAANRQIPMEPAPHGYFVANVPDVPVGTRYTYVWDGVDRPDPASRWQPDGVFGPSAVVGDDFHWTDDGWRGLPLSQTILYELHVGTFTPEGTFEAAITRLDDLVDLGVTAVELMPVAQVSGTRNWGYDGVLLFAAQHSYGGPDGLRRLVDACHARGLAVYLDAVYNHFGPEGSVVWEYGYYFTDIYTSPWGAAVNFDGPHSDEVRRYFIENALMWLRDYHIDGLRLDATDQIKDTSARPFLAELSAAADALRAQTGRTYHLIAENTQNDARLISPRRENGLGMDAVWNDQFHHALRTLLTGDRSGYYEDFGALDQLMKGYREGYVFSGEYSPHFGRRHGTSSAHLPAERFVVFNQNHDHIGNRLNGDRLGQNVPFDALKLAAAATLLSPYVPLLFMGEEYDEQAPFQFFVEFSDTHLIEAVRTGRRREFAAFMQGEVDAPDPQSVETFNRSKLNWEGRTQGHGRVLLAWYKHLIALRKVLPALAALDKAQMQADVLVPDAVVWLCRRHVQGDVAVLLNFSGQPQHAPLPTADDVAWRVHTDSGAWPADGQPPAAALNTPVGEGDVLLQPYQVLLLTQNR